MLRVIFKPLSHLFDKPILSAINLLYHFDNKSLSKITHIIGRSRAVDKVGLSHQLGRIKTGAGHLWNFLMRTDMHGTSRVSSVISVCHNQQIFTK